MADTLLDDVMELLDKGEGDERILKQILRACQNDEVVSNYERRYVEKLVGQHQDNAVELTPSILPSPVPSVIQSPESISATRTVTSSPTSSTRHSKNTKLFVGVGIGALAILIAVAVSIVVSPATPPVVPSDVSVSTANLSLNTDLPSYQKGDLVSISGKSHISGQVNLSITNPSGLQVWSESISAKNDGRYSTLTIAGGNGWEESGTFTVTSMIGSESTLSTFLFSE